MREATYSVPKYGLATSFTEASQPPSYASKFRNRFKNAEGGAEKRQGITRLGNTVPGQPSITGIHELVDKTGVSTILVSGDGMIFKFDGTDYAMVYSGLDPNAIIGSIQMGDRLIFYNGVDRDIYTEDGTSFQELKALIEVGLCSSSATSTTLTDTDITNWVNGTDVVDNDLVYNRTKDAYGIVTAVASAAVTHTKIGPTATGIGVATSAQEANDGYEVIDLVELNIIEDASGQLDNVATAASGTSTSVISVSGVTFSTTEIKVGDIIYNTSVSAGAVTRVTSVSANINVVDVDGQTTGDSLVFLKSAMPISSFAHVHFGRLYHIDARDKRKVRISGADDPTDMTTDAGTLDSVTYNFGSQQPQGDTLVALKSFQRFFMALGQKNIYAFSGTTPIGTTSDFEPIGLFPQGCVSPYAVESLGNDLVFINTEGLQSISLVDDASNLNRASLSDQIRTTLREEIKVASTPELRLIHYPRRSWLLLKVGSLQYCFNYTSQPKDPNRSVAGESGSWALFDGPFARQAVYYVRLNGDLLCAGPNGNVYLFDQGAFADDGSSYTTEYRTAWLSLEEPKNTVRHKRGVYIKPIFDAGGAIIYTVRAEAGFDAESTDTVTISASGGASPIGLAVVGAATIGGSSVRNQKYDLRWKGERVRVTFETNDELGPDIIDKFTLYANLLGRP